MRLNSNRQEELVLNNLKLVHFLVRKLNVSPNDYDDLISIGTIGLIKAAVTFDESRNCKFSTYASHCINNEIFMHFRKENANHQNISLNSPILNSNCNGTNKDIEFIDTLEFSDQLFTESVETNMVFEECISIILNVLSPRDKIIMLYYLAGVSQEVIAQMLNLSQSYISRLTTKLSKKIKNYFMNNTKFVEIFHMEIVKNSYLISFFPQDVPEFTESFLVILQNSQLSKTSHKFKIFYDKNRIFIKIAASPQSFSIVAKVFQELYKL